MNLTIYLKRKGILTLTGKKVIEDEGIAIAYAKDWIYRHMNFGEHTIITIDGLLSYGKVQVYESDSTRIKKYKASPEDFKVNETAKEVEGEVISEEEDPKSTTTLKTGLQGHTKKRGVKRPKKDDEVPTNDTVSVTVPLKRGRGRPKKETVDLGDLL